jgi:hypothetical protein
MRRWIWWGLLAVGCGSTVSGVDPNTMHCGDKVKNADETDVDCGGSCGSCEGGKQCLQFGDCKSKVCNAGTCADQCGDDQQDGDETDLDCGGSCKKCGDGKKCSSASDCQSGTCNGGTCALAPNCMDKVKNGAETDVDCGGACPKCDIGKSCKLDADCVGANCSGATCCGANLGNCDGNIANGCEAKLDHDANNCGACGKTCGASTPACSAGMCIASPPSCKAIKQSDGTAKSGVYTIQPAQAPAPVMTFCDMDTDSGGWTLILNRLVNSDNNGQPDLTQNNGTFADTRAMNFNFDVHGFWSASKQAVFAAKQNDNCASCLITGYDSAVRVDLPSVPGYSNKCSGASSPLSGLKLVGPSANTSAMVYMCGASLGWGACGGNACHYGVNWQNTALDNDWSANNPFELHFPSAYSTYKSAGDANAKDGSAFCRSCAGGLSSVFNNSSTCCITNGIDDKSRWTIWVR